MLSARALANISDDITELYSQLESEIKKDIFRRLNRLQKVTDATTWQAEILKETGGLKSNIDKLVKKYNASSQKMLKDLFYSAMDESKNNDIKYYSLAARNLSASQKQKLNTSIDRLYNAEVINKTFAAQQAQLEKLYNDVTRMTLTVADASEKEFLKQCNNAYLKVNSGAFSWDNAYKDAINAQAREAYADAAVNLANNGVKTILYNYSGTPREYSIEAATKMNILTGINLAASQQTLENAAALGCDLVETSAHIGARDVERPGKPWSSHAAWQGRVFCLNGERDYIDGDGNTRHAANFQESCGLGEPDGICGINCRHSYYPYFEGTPLMYSKGELDEMNEKLVKLDGRNITPYEAEQELRLCERNIREYKAQAAALEMTGNTQNPKYTRARENIYKWQTKARHIVDETGIKRKYINEYIGTRDGVQPRGIAPKIKHTLTTSTPINPTKAQTIANNVNNAINNAAKIPLDMNAKAAEFYGSSGSLQNIVSKAAATQTMTKPQEAIIIEGKNLVTQKFKRELKDINKVLKAQGFDGLPSVLNKDDFIKAVKEDTFFAQRTYTAPDKAKLDSYIEMLRNGEFYVDCRTGGRAHGKGFYCAADYSKGFDLRRVVDEMEHYQTLGMLSRGEQYTMTECVTLHPSAKIIDEENVVNEFVYQYSQAMHKKGYTIRQINDFLRSDGVLYRDVGVLAAQLGYDAIRAKTSPRRADYMVILNRTKLILLGG